MQMVVNRSSMRHRLMSTASSASLQELAGGTIASLYRRGAGRRGVGAGQPRVVASVSGGGGHLFSWMLSQPGASSCLLEGRVPYDKASCAAFLAEHGRSTDSLGFCSAEMAANMAAAARDRAIMLTPKLKSWPDCIGVACTATIVSHFTRRGDYRVHSATCTGEDGSCQVYSHALVKGARDRPGEDAACALLTLRALAEAVGGVEGASDLKTLGVRMVDTPAANALGEAASGVEQVPEPRVVMARGAREPEAAAEAALVLIPQGAQRSPAVVPLPRNGALPQGTLVIPWDSQLGGAASAMAAAAEALSALGLEGDGGDGAWSEAQAPALFEAPHQDHAAAYLGVDATRQLTNWACLRPADAASTPPPDEPDELLPPAGHRALSGALPPGVNVLLSPVAAHAMLASILADWEQADGVARLSGAIAAGTRFVVARGTNPASVELEAAAREAAQEDLPPACRSAFTFVSDRWFDGAVSGLSDGSPSTDGVDAVYTGGWDADAGRPQGQGICRWSNGITYEGRWRNGVYDGFGVKSYSRGGGYSGMWRQGERHGWGASHYDGKWGFERWEGPFESDAPHGMGVMHLRDKAAVAPNAEQADAVAFEFVHGQPKN